MQYSHIQRVSATNWPEVIDFQREPVTSRDVSDSNLQRLDVGVSRKIFEEV